MQNNTFPWGKVAKPLRKQMREDLRPPAFYILHFAASLSPEQRFPGQAALAL